MACCSKQQIVCMRLGNTALINLYLHRWQNPIDFVELYCNPVAQRLGLCFLVLGPTFQNNFTIVIRWCSVYNYNFYNTCAENNTFPNSNQH